MIIINVLLFEVVVTELYLLIKVLLFISIYIKLTFFLFCFTNMVTVYVQFFALHSKSNMI